MQECCKNLVAVDMTLRDQTDQTLLIGNVHEINGGLFKVIAQANASAPGVARDDSARDGAVDSHVLVTARANETGQFLLRELLEDGDSKTHTRAVSMRRVMVVISLDEGCALSDPVKSRAFDVIE